MLIGAIGALAVVGAIVAAVVLVAGGGSDSHDRQASIPVVPTTPTTVDPAVAEAEQEYRDYVQRIENILQQSANGRGQVAPLVAGVENGCQIAPSDASQQIRTVIDNRTSILNQLSGLARAPNAEAQNFVSLLQQALQSSIDADIQYKGWFDYLYTDYYYTSPVGCPGGTPPRNDAFNAARSADARSTQLKVEFVNVFNPVAIRFGQSTWSESDF